MRKIGEEVGAEKNDVKNALDELIGEGTAAGRGIQIMEVDGEYQMSTNPDTAKIVKEFLKDEITGELTRPALETLTIVAYRGPISKPDLEQIRGVNCSLILRNLMIKGLAEAKASDKGGEALYNITFDFMRYLGIKKTSELPDYDKLSRSEIFEKILDLSAEKEQPQDKISV